MFRIFVIIINRLWPRLLILTDGDGNKFGFRAILKEKVKGFLRRDLNASQVPVLSMEIINQSDFGTLQKKAQTSTSCYSDIMSVKPPLIASLFYFFTLKSSHYPRKIEIFFFLSPLIPTTFNIQVPVFLFTVFWSSHFVKHQLYVFRLTKINISPQKCLINYTN